MAAETNNKMEHRGEFYMAVMAESTVEEVVLSNSNQYKQIDRMSKITLDEPTDFIIKNDWFGGGNAEITSNNEAVYQMVRTEGEMANNGCQLTINNMSGVPLLIMRYDFTTISGHTMTLSRSDLSSVPICKITRNSCKLTLHHRFDVELLGPTASNYRPDVRQFSIHCKGHWPKSFTFEATHSGEILASVQKTIVKKWQLHVSAGEDILLFIGIACAIDFISHESTYQKTNIPESVETMQEAASHYIMKSTATNGKL